MSPRSRTWRFLDTGPGDAFLNMAVDEALAASVAERRSGPVVRVFGWEPAAVSFGSSLEVLRGWLRLQPSR